MENTFFATLFRMKYISRWGLMRCNFGENLSEHSLEVAFLAHALALIGNQVFGKAYDWGAVCVKAMYHDAPEILTGDLPTPIKYHDDEIMSAYRRVETIASKKLLGMLPEELQPAFEPILTGQTQRELHPIVKAADKLSAYIKCIEERKAGNNEFLNAEKQTLEAIHAYNMPEAEYFIEHFIPAFEKTLDELGTIK
mgnify:CR=1 FL=1